MVQVKQKSCCGNFFFFVRCRLVSLPLKYIVEKHLSCPNRGFDWIMTET